METVGGAISASSHTIAVLLINYESKERVQQMFSDLNRFVVKTSKSLDILYDKRDKISAATLAFLDLMPLFKKLTEKDDASLRTKSPKLFTLAALYDADRELLKGKEDDEVIQNAALLKTFWGEVAKHGGDLLSCHLLD
jgi:DNA sulfur modification protein DndB